MIDLADLKTIDREIKYWIDHLDFLLGLVEDDLQIFVGVNYD